MAKIQNDGNTKCWDGCGATETLIIIAGNKGDHDSDLLQPVWKG